MAFKQKIILIHSDKGGCGTSTISATLAKKLAKPKKTVLITLCKHSEFIYEKCGVKSPLICVSSLDEIFTDMDAKNKMLKKYEFIIFDISAKTHEHVDTIDNLYNRADIIIKPVPPSKVGENSIKILEEKINSGSIKSKKHIYPVIAYTKAHYNVDNLESTRKKLDKCSRSCGCNMFDHYIGYSKSIENEKRVLDTKDCKPAILKFVEIIKSL